MSRGERLRWESDKHLILLPYQETPVIPHESIQQRTAVQPQLQRAPSEHKWERAPGDATSWESETAKEECAVLLRKCELADSEKEKDGYINIIL